MLLGFKKYEVFLIFYKKSTNLRLKSDSNLFLGVFLGEY